MEEFKLVEYADFIRQVSYIEKREDRATRQQYVMSAYAVWLRGSTGKNTFKEYLNVLGLSEKQPKLTRKQKRKLAVRGINTALKILKMKTIKKKKK